MGYRLTITGEGTTIQLDRRVVKSIIVNAATAGTAFAKTNITATMIVTGKLLSNKEGLEEVETEKLFQWSLIPPEAADSYRNVVAEVTAEGRMTRKIYFPNAFIVDYTEKYVDTEGVGEFTLVMRQKLDSVSDVKSESGMPADDFIR